MTIRIFSRDQEQEIFEPNTIAALAAALKETLHQLGLVDRNDPAVTIIAKRLIELARRGERDPIRLRDDAIQSVRKGALPF
jgi:hypothetical protein